MIVRPGRYTFRVEVPPGTLASGTYHARVVIGLIKDEQFSRLTRRGAFMLEVYDLGEDTGDDETTRGSASGRPPQASTIEEDGENESEPPAESQINLLDTLPWGIEAGDGPWASSSEGGDDGV